MPYLPPGTYRLTATARGFKTALRENVILSVAQTLTVDFQLEVGAVTEQVTVSSDPPLLESSASEIGQYVSKKEFDTWPITVGDGRRQIQQFIFTSLPGTVGGTFQGSINGGRYYSHEILIEGIALGRMDLQGGSNNEFSPSADSVSEFKLQTGVIGAQYSGGQTSVANFVTKSGTNDLHGSGYWYIQNDALRANGYNNNANRIKRQPFKQHNYGYTVGGRSAPDLCALANRPQHRHFLNGQQVLDAEVQTDAEQQQDDPELSELIGQRPIRHKAGRAGTHQEAGEQVADKGERPRRCVRNPSVRAAVSPPVRVRIRAVSCMRKGILALE